MNFKEINKDYRPIPFWSWNDKLEPSEVKRQVKVMSDAGMGGFFMHARGGLKTDYMSEEWFENVEAAIEQAEKEKIDAWAYDENGWPSGFGNGLINGMGVEYQQKYLRFEYGNEHDDTSIINKDGVNFYYEVNPFYVDVLDPKVTKKFLDEIYMPYYERYKNRITGFFTDEPQISRGGLPWSFVMPDYYRQEYNEELTDRLIELFKPTGDYRRTRIRFWKMVTDLFSAGYMKQIYDWCDSRGLEFTGHLLMEDRLEQLTTSGSCMAQYEYFHMPGIDKLTRNINDSLAPIQLGSVAAQFGKKRVLTESFAMSGHNVSFSELRGLTEWQMRYGISVLCPHLEGYSLRGIRKRDYPPAMYEQQPWWSEYPKFIDAMSRIGMILAESKVECKTLLMHPQTMAWVEYDPANLDELIKLDRKFKDTISMLERKHIMFHLGDETVMERHAKVDGKTLVIGTQAYDKIVVMPGQFFMKKTQALLDEYKKNGGKILYAEDLEENPIIDNPEIKYTERIIEGEKLYYFVNHSGKPQNANISVGNRQIDIMTGEVLPFDGYVSFKEYDSIIVIGDRHDEVGRKTVETDFMDLSGDWEIKESTHNVLTLDKCDYYFDGKLQEKNGYVLNIQNRACELKRPTRIKQVYRVEARYAPSEIYLLCETPQIYEISVNNKKADMKDCGWAYDRSFRKINISGMFKSGVNEISMECDFAQSAEVYENIEKSKIFESEKNKLAYDTEIEPIYLYGVFSVYAKGDFKELDNNAMRCAGDFVIDKPKKSVSLKNIERQGFLFYAGKMTIEKTVECDGNNQSIKLGRTGINAIGINVNGKELPASIWNGDVIDIGDYLKKGNNTIRLTLINNLRNMLGPHNVIAGESYSVMPCLFYKEPCVWKKEDQYDNWCDDYCFVELSVF